MTPDEELEALRAENERLRAAAAPPVPPAPVVLPSELAELHRRITSPYTRWNDLSASELHGAWERAFAAAGGEYVDVTHSGEFEAL